VLWRQLQDRVSDWLGQADEPVWGCYGNCQSSDWIFLRDEDGRRPVFGGAGKFQSDPNWRDYLLFYEYFHGDNGAGLGASHQTGWTGIVAGLIDEIFGKLAAESFLKGSREVTFE